MEREAQGQGNLLLGKEIFTMPAQAPIEPSLLSYWFLNQLFKNHATVDHFINIRCVVNPRPKTITATARANSSTPTAQYFIPWANLHTQWACPGGFYDRLKNLNETPEAPANIYYATALRHRAAHKMSKESCIGYTCSFLDMDVTSTWSLQDRYQQINFLTMAGFRPSIIVASGRGIQPIWLWNTRIDAALGAPILKNMVNLACCTEGGQCWDVTRLLRLPGFQNVKKWFDHEILGCTVLWPDQDTIIKTNAEGTLLPRYSWEHFKHFPVCGKDAIATAYREAIQIGGDPMQNLEEIAVSVAGHQHAERIQIAADRVKEAQAQPVADPDGSTKETYAPRFNKVPIDFDEIGLKKGHSQWFKLYCTKGFNDLTKGELDKISAKLNISGEASASEFDAKVVYSLIRARYSFEAIDEFWRRPDLRLFREDKFAKNPNYLQLTYDNMMQYYLAAVEQREMQAEEASAALPPNTVFVDGKGLLRISRSAERTDLLLSANMEVLGHYIDMDEPVDGKQEHYHLKVTDFRQHTEEWTLQRAAFSSVKALKEVCKGDVFVLAKHDADLSHLQYYLSSKNGKSPKGQFHSAVKYIGEENRFAFPHYVIGKDEINMYTNPTILKIMAKHLPICKAWLNEKPNRDATIREFSRVWPSLLRMHSPRLIVACLGSMMTIAMRQIFQYHEKMDISIPTINFRGSSCSGKTETLYQMYRLTGSLDPAQQRLSAASSIFGLSKLIEICRCIPLLVDEFKEEDEGVGRNAQMMNIRQLVRRIYSGEAVAKGRADLSVVTSVIKAALWIAGESILERAGHLAELTRIFPIDTDNWDTRKSRKEFQLVRASHIETIGPFIYQFLLNKNPHEEWIKFHELELHYMELLEPHFGRLCNRAATNVTCLVYGINLWDQFLASINTKLQPVGKYTDIEEEVTAYLIHHADHSGDLIKIQHEGKEVMRERNEGWRFLQILGQMVQNKDKRITELDDKYAPCYAISEDKLFLYVYPHLAYDAYKEYSLQHQYPAFEKTTILARFQTAAARGEEWVDSADAYHGEPGRVPQLAVKFRLPVLINAGFWPESVATTQARKLANVDDFLAGS